MTGTFIHVAVQVFVCRKPRPRRSGGDAPRRATDPEGCFGADNGQPRCPMQNHHSDTARTAMPTIGLQRITAARRALSLTTYIIQREAEPEVVRGRVPVRAMGLGAGGHLRSLGRGLARCSARRRAAGSHPTWRAVCGIASDPAEAPTLLAADPVAVLRGAHCSERLSSQRAAHAFE